MTAETHFIDRVDGAWIKGVPCLIPNLRKGQYVIMMDDKSKGYMKWRWRIYSIETIVGSTADTVLQNVFMICCGTEEEWQATSNAKNN